MKVLLLKGQTKVFRDLNYFADQARNRARFLNYAIVNLIKFPRNQHAVISGTGKFVHEVLLKLNNQVLQEAATKVFTRRRLTLADLILAKLLG